jgi:hypothetical protein
MKEKLTSAINFALQNKISEMSCDISDVMKNKIKDKIAEKKKKVAEDFMGESEAHEVKLVESRYNRDVDFDDEGRSEEDQCQKYIIMYLLNKKKKPKLKV